MKKALAVLGILFGAYLVVRAAIEPFVIDFNDPSTYQRDWGGPSLAGVLAVHCGPGVVALVIFAAVLARRRRKYAVTD
ncbi:hypothetical protein O7635_12620 [Asanoa sp. WMMD1127]|uniref:hypothetical protein n=1 Tax=Asanoa sp. WMMD1127 TaxID=3016107 RepID=UPI00241745D4|nr:hypothetical protein [Asanoa sp. WMMD1127]MDG4822694.1 hypothetical protein [Asanoa sp. WMMD1127]